MNPAVAAGSNEQISSAASPNSSTPFIQKRASAEILDEVTHQFFPTWTTSPALIWSSVLPNSPQKVAETWPCLEYHATFTPWNVSGTSFRPDSIQPRKPGKAAKSDTEIRPNSNPAASPRSLEVPDNEYVGDIPDGRFQNEDNALTPLMEKPVHNASPCPNLNA